MPCLVRVCLELCAKNSVVICPTSSGDKCHIGNGLSGVAGRNYAGALKWEDLDFVNSRPSIKFY
ncbi:hypothetical protein LINPERHAP1_LOCUS24937 [Linum perenne]